jgi:thioredoxin 1
MADIFYFSTTWCQPCKTFKPIVVQASSEAGKHINFIDAESNKDLANRYGINSVPTIVVVRDGKVEFRHSGVISKSDLLNLLNKF